MADTNTMEAPAQTDEERSKDEFFRRLAVIGEDMIAAHGKDFAIGALVLLARHGGAEARHRARLGDTSKLWAGLLVDDLDVYCEYTGTLTQETLAGEDTGDERREPMRPLESGRSRL